MSKCNYCNVTITDDTSTCPLCKGVLEPGGDAENNYPDVRAGKRHLVFVRSIVMFAAVVSIISCFFADSHTENGIDWSLMVCGFILCGLFVFLVMTDPVAGYRKRVIAGAFCVLAAVLLADLGTGYHGWSVNFAIPGLFFFINLGLILLMIINRRSWQSYMILQIGVILIGIIQLVMIYVGIVTFPLLSELAFGSSLILFLGTLIFGGRVAKLELERRFHI